MSANSERLLELALERGAIKYGDFTLTSGIKSSYYFDGRLLSLDPEGANLIASALLPLLWEAGAEAVGGTTLGADPIVASVALASYRKVRLFLPSSSGKRAKNTGPGRISRAR